MDQPRHSVERSREKDIFDYLNKFMRTHVEPTFGIIVMRWVLLWRALNVSILKAAQIATVDCLLHNQLR